jgi:hypothetical protein
VGEVVFPVEQHVAGRVWCMDGSVSRGIFRILGGLVENVVSGWWVGG